MNRFTLLSGLLSVYSATVWSQCTVTKDGFGQVVTICEAYTAEAASRLPTSTHQQVSYRGSEFFTFPVWQKGTIQLDQSGKEIPCLLSFNLVTHEVMCMITKDMEPRIVTPYAFTINNTTFVRQPKALFGIKYEAYAMLLYNGQTKLLKSLTSRLIQKSVANGYDKVNAFNGYYETRERYYIQKGETPPQPTTLTKRSLLTLLPAQADRIAPQLVDKQLTENDVVKTLTYYDSLMAVTDLNHPELSADAVFYYFLQMNVKYPNRAWNNAVYGRVYAGFDVDEAGQITNITLLSPNNIGYGFDQAVLTALQKVTKVKLVTGKYALPVSFTYTNRLDKATSYVPVNTLSSTRLEGRTLLNELVVPVTVSKPVSTIREVWGYYQ